MYTGIRYEAELRYKQQRVRMHCTIGGLNPELCPIIPCDRSDHYRNKRSIL
ncbi:MAG: hypothetical protein ACLRXC_11050 [[Clostridium] leptum]